MKPTKRYYPEIKVSGAWERIMDPPDRFFRTRGGAQRFLESKYPVTYSASKGKRASEESLTLRIVDQNGEIRWPLSAKS